MEETNSRGAAAWLWGWLLHQALGCLQRGACLLQAAQSRSQESASDAPWWHSGRRRAALRLPCSWLRWYGVQPASESVAALSCSFLAFYLANSPAGVR